MQINQIFEQLIEHHHLSPAQMQEVMTACMQGELNDIQIGAFLALMRMKGETVSELSTAATVMMRMAHCIDLGEGLIDIAGTGGDGKNTFNISTVSSFVAAAAGAKIAKHGGRSVSSKSGTADFLLQAGFAIELSDEQLQLCVQQCGIGFLFAPHFHQAMQHARPARQALGIRTLFNLLGPLINPAQVKRMVVGVAEKQKLESLAQVLTQLGKERFLVVHSQDGLDEISIAAPTEIMEYHQGKLKHWTLHAEEYGLAHENLDPIVVNSPSQSLALGEEVLSGKKGAARDIVVLNSAAVIYCADITQTFSQAVEKAQHAIDSNEAASRFLKLKHLTQTWKSEA